MAVIKKKCWPEFFEKFASGELKTDLRLADFKLKTGDTLVMQEYDPETGVYTGRTMPFYCEKVEHVAGNSFPLSEQDPSRFYKPDDIKEHGFWAITLGKKTLGKFVFPKKSFLAVLVFIVVLGATYYLASAFLFKLKNKPVVCPEDVKVCPNGSVVNRVAPTCNFASCPGEDIGTWQISSDSVKSLSFKYPAKLMTTYIRAVDWPPKINVTVGPFICLSAGSLNAPGGQTQKQTINGNEYCVTKESQGAAGSIYTLYAYAFPVNDKVAILNFSLQFPQCVNYPQPQQSACQNEENNFDIGSTVDQIARTLTWQSGIQGTVMLGPLCPVESFPPNKLCANEPYQTQFQVLTASGKNAVKDFGSDVLGQFKVELPPGDYLIFQGTTTSAYPHCSEIGPITVRAGDFASTTINCDTGIR